MSRPRILDAAKPPPTAAEDNAAETLNDIGNKDRFVAACRDRLAFVPEKKKWREWTGLRWRDDNGAALRAAELVALALFEAARVQPDGTLRDKLFAHANRTSNIGGTRAMVSCAEHSDLVIPQSQWDKNPNLLGIRNGTIDLRTGELFEADPSEHISKYGNVKYDPDAKCPQWHTFLKRIMQDNDEMISFLRRVAGYSLLGHNHERVLFILFGGGANGKSKFIETVEFVMGDYSISTPASTLMVKRVTGVPNDVARLAGARMVTAIETEKGHRISEALVKSLTGDDRISARFLFNEFFDFTPVAKIFIATNHRPEVRGTDQAIWDRLILIPFEVTIPRKERDKELGGKLRKEAAGIFNWMLEGCLEWQESGLQPPDTVRSATSDYRHDMDVIGRWKDGRLVDERGSYVYASHAYNNYKDWCERTNERPVSFNVFGEEMTNRGIRKKEFSKGIRYLDVTINADRG